MDLSIQASRELQDVAAYKRYIGIVERTVQPEIGPLLALILVTVGFLAGDGGASVASDGGAVLAVFGAHTSRGGFNFLRHTQYFSARSICAHALSHPGVLHDPNSAPNNAIYSSAERELGDAARDSSGKMKPAWLLRQILDEKLSAGTTPY